MPNIALEITESNDRSMSSRKWKQFQFPNTKSKISDPIDTDIDDF